MSQVETAGDCYIVAGALMTEDEEGFLSLEEEADPVDGAERVMEFGKVRGKQKVRVMKKV